jgi:hypothetical protein
MKGTKKNYHLKFKDKVVDSAANSTFIFNKTPILVPVLGSSQQSGQKRERQKSANISRISRYDESFKKIDN